MTRIVRICLLAVLIVSLPMHAAYGLSMAQCMALEQTLAPASQPDSATHASDGGCAHAQPLADASDSGSTERGPVQPHCGSCSYCGTSTALISTIEPHLATSFYFSHPSLGEQRLQSVIPSRLDRPPLQR